MAVFTGTTLDLPTDAGVLTMQDSAGTTKSVFYPGADTPYPDAALFMASPAAVPGEPFLAVGHFSGIAQPFLRVAGSDTLVQCEVQVSGPKALLALVPDTLPLTQYALVIKDGNVTTNTLLLNDPRVLHADWPKIVSGASFKLIGRNLLFADVTPRVFLADGSTLLECTVNVAASTNTRLSVTAPAGLTVGTSYVPVVNNGLVASEAGNVPTPLALECLAPVATSLKLDPRVAAGFPFLANEYQSTDSRFTQLVADGTTNNTPAINDALSKISSWGGGLYNMPAGAYRIDPQNIVGSLNPAVKTFLCGAGEGVTTLLYGYGDKSGFGFALYVGTNNIGVANLSFENVNEKGAWDANCLLNGGDSQLDNVTFHNVGFSMFGQSLKTTSGVTRLHFNGGHYTNRALRTSGTVSEGPFTLHNCQNLWMRGVYTLHEVGQTALRESSNICIENPRFVRDAAINNGPNKLEADCRGGSADFVENLAIWGGSIDTINGPATDANTSGETWLSEGGGPTRGDSEWGSVSSASATTLVDSTASFGSRDRHGVLAKPMVAIMNGRGAYQWRYCTITNGTTLTLERPWTITPDSTSTYSLTNWSAKGWTVSGVAANNNRAGLAFFAASTWDIVVEDLTFNNNHAILFKPYQRAKAYNGGASSDGACTPCWSAQLLYNSVADTGNLIPYVPAYIGVAAISTVAEVIGGLAVGIEMRYNRVNALPGYVPFPAVEGANNEYPYNDDIQRNGFYFRTSIQAFNEDGQFIGNRGIPLIVGCFGLKDTARNCEATYYVDSSAYVTMVIEGDRFNTPEVVSDVPLGDEAVGSKLTRILTRKPVVPVKPPVTPPVTPPGPTGSDARVAPDPATGPPNGVNWQDPIELRSEMRDGDGVIRPKGHYRSTNAGTAAITLNCGATPVDLSQMLIAHAGRGISGGTGSNLRGRDISLYGLNTQVDNQVRERGIHISKGTNVDLQYITLESSGGVYCEEWTGNHTPSQSLKIQNLKSRNIIGSDGTGSDGAGGYRSIVQLKDIRTNGMRLAYIEGYNEADKSRIEDTFNLFRSGGLDANNPLLGYGLLGYGSYPFPATATRYTGAVFSADGGYDSSRGEMPPAFILLDELYGISNCNAVGNIAVGHDIAYRNIRAVTSGYLPDGRMLQSSYKAFSINNFYDQAPGYNKTISGITTLFYRTKDVYRRADFVADPNYDPNPDPGIDVANAILLPDVTSQSDGLAKEAKLFRDWIAFLNKNNQTCGSRYKPLAS